MRALAILFDLFIPISIIYFFYQLYKKRSKKKNYIVPKEGETVTLVGGLKGTVIGYVNDTVVVEVHAELSDIQH